VHDFLEEIMPNLNYHINNLSSIATEREVLEGYTFISLNLKRANSLDNIKKINFFVGSNNSGKSRLLRSIFQKDLYKIFNDHDTGNYINEIKNEYEKDILNISRNHGFDKEIQSYLKNQHDFFESQFDSGDYYGIDLSLDELGKIVIDISDYKTLNDVIGGDEVYRSENSSFLKTITSKAKEYKAKVSPFNPYLLTYLYIPVLRGLRELSQEKCFYNRTIKDYFLSKDEKDLISGDNNKEIFTGLGMYEDVKKQLLSLQEDRDKIREYEKFLSENFFDNKPVSLVPHIDSDVLFIKIGDDDELPIYDVGDGIQQLIILTYPLFKNIGKNMFIFMEEPELYLHPGLQRRFVEILRSERFNTFKFFIATHSNNFLDISLENESKDISIYTFEKNDKDKTFMVKNVASGDNNILKLLGANNTSMFMSNCSIWVEGVTDRIYLRSYLKAYEEELIRKGELKQRFKEGVHYSFFEYAGSNLAHYMFEEPKELNENIIAKYLSNRVFLIADKDKGKEEKHKTLTEASERNKSKFIYKMLPVREIENLLNEELLKTVFNEVFKIKLDDDMILDNNFENKYFGTYFKEKLEDFKDTFTLKSGTISTYYKNKLANAVSQNVTWEKMSENAKALTTEIFEFIESSNS